MINPAIQANIDQLAAAFSATPHARVQLANSITAIVKSANSNDALIKALERMTQTFKPFTMKPIGGEGSLARIEQQDQIEAHAEAIKALALAKGRAA